MKDQIIITRPEGAPISDLRETRRFLRDHQPGDHNRLYRAYAVVICALLLGAPSMWSLIGVIAQLEQTIGAGSVQWGLHLAASLVLALTAVMPSHAGLIVSTARELFYFVDGPFGVRGTLLSRTWLLYALTAAAGGLISAVFAIGLGLPASAAVLTIGSGIGLGGLLAGSLVCLQTPWASKCRWAAGLGGMLLAATSASFMSFGAFPVVITSLQLGGAVALMVFIPRLLDRVWPGQLELDQQSRQNLLSGLMVGDARALGSTVSKRVRRFRGLSATFGGSSYMRVLRVDALSLLRTPTRTTTTLLAGIGCGTLTAAAGSTVVGAAVAMMVIERVFGTLAKGFMDYIDSVGADRIDPEPFWAAAAKHLMLPWTLLVITAMIGFCGAGLFFHPAPLSLATAALLLTAAPCVAIFLSGSAGAPVRMLAPVLTPMGDASSLALILWMVRGLVPAGLLVLIAVKAGLAAGVLVLIPTCAVLAVLRMRRLAAVESTMAGHVWRKS